MPIREFICKDEKCAARTEKVMKMDDDTKLIECPSCGSEAERTIALPANPVFKGSGFTPKFHA